MSNRNWHRSIALSAPILLGLLVSACSTAIPRVVSVVSIGTPSDPSDDITASVVRPKRGWPATYRSADGGTLILSDRPLAKEAQLADLRRSATRGGSRVVAADWHREQRLSRGTVLAPPTHYLKIDVFPLRAGTEPAFREILAELAGVLNARSVEYAYDVLSTADPMDGQPMFALVQGSDERATLQQSAQRMVDGLGADRDRLLGAVAPLLRMPTFSYVLERAHPRE